MENARARGDRWFIGECGSVLTYVYLARGEHESARATEMESLAARVALRNRPGIALNLKLIGIADACAGHHDRAALLFGGATAIEETTGEVWNKHWLGAYQQAISQARDKLGSSRFTERWRAGRTMREADVIMIALARSQAAASPRGADGLTSRETQVSELIAEGITSQEIAHRLGIGRRTAEAHTEHIMTKLGVRSRAQVAVWVERIKQTRRYV
jgi:DNA-binding CsgD family transcriptional regulator